MICHIFVISYDIFIFILCFEHIQIKDSVKEPNKFHINETDKITRKASDAAEYIELFGSFTRDRHA